MIVFSRITPPVTGVERAEHVTAVTVSTLAPVQSLDANFDVTAEPSVSHVDVSVDAVSESVTHAPGRTALMDEGASFGRAAAGQSNGFRVFVPTQMSVTRVPAGGVKDGTHAVVVHAPPALAFALGAHEASESETLAAEYAAGTVHADERVKYVVRR